MRLKYIVPGKKNIDARVSVEKVLEPEDKTTKQGISIKMQNIEVADETGSMLLVLWGENTGKYQPGDVLNIKGAYALSYEGTTQLRLMKSGSIVVEKDTTEQEQLGDLPADGETELKEADAEFKSPRTMED